MLSKNPRLQINGWSVYTIFLYLGLNKWGDISNSANFYNHDLLLIPSILLFIFSIFLDLNLFISITSSEKFSFLDSRWSSLLGLSHLL